MTRPLILGTRGSPLARWQTEHVLAQLHQVHPALKTEIRLIKTQGDLILDLPLAQIGDKGLFTKELELALHRGEIDLAIHSLKDLPTTLPPGLVLGAILERHDPQDVLVSRTHTPLSALPHGARIGTGSLRRKTQLQALRPDCLFFDLRGNIQTRLDKLDRGDYDAIIMARAALERLGLHQRISEILPTALMLPAVGQGAIGIETRAEDHGVLEHLKGLHHLPTAHCCIAERAFLRTLGGGCETPIAAHAILQDHHLEIYAYISSIDGKKFLKDHSQGPIESAELIGQDLALRMLAAGADELLQTTGQNT